MVKMIKKNIIIVEFDHEHNEVESFVFQLVKKTYKNNTTIQIK